MKKDLTFHFDYDIIKVGTDNRLKGGTNMAKRKIDPKAVLKNKIMTEVAEFLKENYTVTANADDVYGFTKGTIVANNGTYDIQIKPIATKANTNTYPKLEG